MIDYRGLAAAWRRAGCAWPWRWQRPDAPVEAEVAALGRGCGRRAGRGRAWACAASACRPFGAINALRRVVMLVECAAAHRERVAAHRDGYNPQTVARMEPGFQFSGVDYARALSARAPLLRRFCAEVFAEADILALPTCPVTTPGIAETDTGGDARFTAIANRLGHPGGAVQLPGPAGAEPARRPRRARHAARAAAGGAPVRRRPAAARRRTRSRRSPASLPCGRRSPTEPETAAGCRRRPAALGRAARHRAGALRHVHVRADGRGQQVPEHALPDAADHLAALRVHDPDGVGDPGAARPRPHPALGAAGAAGAALGAAGGRDRARRLVLRALAVGRRAFGAGADPSGRDRAVRAAAGRRRWGRGAGRRSGWASWAS